MGKIIHIRRVFVTFIILFVSIYSVSAYDESKVHVTKTDLSQFNFEVGPSVHVSFLDSEKKIDFGVYYSLTFTPVRFNEKFSLGVKVNIDVGKLFDFIKDFSKAQTLFEITLDFRYLYKKSIEVYGALGGNVLVYDYNGIKDFNQKFGIVLQGGARGRLNDVIGLGLQGSISIINPHIEDKELTVDKSLSMLVIRGYFSVEI